MKYMFSVLMFLLVSTVSFAQGNILPPPAVELTSFVKEQTGIYQVSVGTQTETLPSTGMSLELFTAGERVLLNGTFLDTDFVFATLYNKRGEYFVMNGPVTGKVASVDVYRVTTGASGVTTNTLVGLGTLTVDKDRKGYADAISYSLFVSTDVLATDTRTNTLLTGTFRRVSDINIIKCTPIVEDVARATSSSPVQCNKTPLQ